MLPVLDRATEVRRLRVENRRLRQYLQGLSYESPRYRMVGSSPAMRRVLGLIEKVAPTGATVLIRGPSGTGKELVARALHHNSPRRERPQVTINRAALQESRHAAAPHAAARPTETDEKGLCGTYLGQQVVAPDEGRSFLGACSSQSGLARAPPRTRN